MAKGRDLSAKTQLICETFHRLAGNVSAVSKELGIPRSTVYGHIQKAGGLKRPLVGGNVTGNQYKKAKLPAAGQIKRYIVTSAQNNTHLHRQVWENLLALSKYYDAKILIGTFSYNKNAYGKLAVKRGTEDHQDELWYDHELEPYIFDQQLELGNGLVWCGKMNILPTAEDPLVGLERYSDRKSAIFPHTKIALRSIATMKGEGTKFNYTTGTVTQRNYIQKKAGLKAEPQHAYGGLIVEVNSEGNWWVRQIEADDEGMLQDLTLRVENGQVHENCKVEAITWGDIHAASIDPIVFDMSAGEHGMLDTLMPNFQFIHDLLAGDSVNHHVQRNPHEKFKIYLQGNDSISRELIKTAEVLQQYIRPWVKTIAVDSNHDNWLLRWLQESEAKHIHPMNLRLFYQGNDAALEAYEKREPFNALAWAMGAYDTVQFLSTDESFTICNRKIECGMHGHLGPDGVRGSDGNLSKIGRAANTGHTHSCAIVNGLYVAGTSTKLDLGYNRGPSSWSHSHIITYPNGKRTIITMYAGKWKA
jgi:hypothetical protein